jgi:hypothetical protein
VRAAGARGAMIVKARNQRKFIFHGKCALVVPVAAGRGFRQLPGFQFSGKPAMCHPGAIMRRFCHPRHPRPRLCNIMVFLADGVAGANLGFVPSHFMSGGGGRPALWIVPEAMVTRMEGRRGRSVAAARPEPGRPVVA